MCGITGAISLTGQPLRTAPLKAMVDAVAHRGPDDAGYLVWQSGRGHPRGKSFGQSFSDARYHEISPLLPPIDSEAGQRRLHEYQWDVFLGHRRLSIIDLTPAGHQPMTEISGRIWLAYNGEIYNFREIRKQLEAVGYHFISNSDTEVLLHSYEEWGIDCIHRLNGMFAFALWDGIRNQLYLGRDRYGIKPLYYAERDGALLFGSEVKSILQYLEGSPSVDLLALNEYFSFQNILSDRTLFEGVHLLPPGHYLELDLRRQSITTHRYWDFHFSGDCQESAESLCDQLEDAIRTAVRRQCVSDVSVGSYLSGGMDSGTITALAARELGRICSFTGGFDLSEAAEHEQAFDERELAEQMANIFQTEHYECVLHSGDMENVMERLVWHLEDLRAGQCYPNYFVSRLASKFVKVSLAGTGGDELFGGYPWRYATAIGPTHEDYIQNYYGYWKRLVRNRDKLRLFQSRIRDTLSDLRDEHGAVPFKNHTLSVFRRVFSDDISGHTLGEQVAGSLYFECKTFLHALLLVDDKLSMAHSLETRVPFLDNDLVDLACKIPVSHKVAGLDRLEGMDENLLHKKAEYHRRMHTGKNILRGAMSRILPDSITGARKQGFSGPDESWFRGRSEQYVYDMVLSPSSRIREYINDAYINEVLEEHRSGRTNKRLMIWSLLSFEIWLRQYQNGKCIELGNIN